MYQIISGQYMLEGRAYISYGICWGKNKIEDISLDRTAVEALVSLCNRETVSPVHLWDIIADFLAAPDDIQWQPRIISALPVLAMQI